MSEALTALDAALDEVHAAELSDSDAVRAMARMHARHEAEWAVMIARWDANKTWAAEGAKSPASWIAIRCRIDKAKAARLLRLGRSVREMPLTQAAWLAGDVSSEHVQVLASVRHIDAFARDEAMLVEDAETMRFPIFVRTVEYWRERNDTDDKKKKAEKQLDGRRFDLSQSFQGMWIGDLRSDPISGEIISVTLRTLEQELWEADWAEAKQRLGRDPLPIELQRTPTQRRHDALVEMATRARVAPADGQRPEPLFTVVGGEDRFRNLCELWSGSVVSPTSLVPWLTDGWIERIIFDSPSRVIDVGAERRIFRGATRRAIEVRDRLNIDSCYADVCDEPIENCQIDHTIEYRQGGLTIQDNGRCACGYHNRLRNKKKPQGP